MHGEWLNSGALQQLLQQGASLVVDSVEELLPSVVDVSKAIEKTLDVHAQVNLYAAWGHDHGFGLHWDTHDALILQIRGHKHWVVYPPTRVDPLKQDKPHTPPPSADATPVWDGLLEQGDVLYLPRGWWHMARPVDAESLHLTIGLTMPTGATVFRWFLERLKEDERVRRTVPLAATSNGHGHAEFAEALRQAWSNAWSPAVVTEFLEWYRSRSVSRPHVSLPPRKPGTNGTSRRYRLAVGREIRAIGEADVVTVRAGAVELNLKKDVSDALCRINHVESTELADLLPMVSPSHHATLRRSLNALTLSGVLWQE
jgi:ribosomal protein L16 Arg81 hydroxylase